MRESIKPVDLQDVEELAESYVNRTGGDLRADISDYEISGPEADEADIEYAADFFMDVYDRLLDVDSSGVREEVQDSIVYDPSLRDRLTPELDFNSALLYSAGLGSGACLALAKPESAEVALAGGLALGHYFQTKWKGTRADQNFDAFSNTIGVSEDPITVKEGENSLASELYHFYQKEFDSSTWGRKGIRGKRDENTQMIREGTERALKLKALEAAAEEELLEEEQDSYYSKLVGSTVINGFAEMADQRAEISIEKLERLGLERDISEDFMDKIGSDNNRFYDIVASAMLTAEQTAGERIYSEVFHGEFDPVDLTGIR